MARGALPATAAGGASGEQKASGTSSRKGSTQHVGVSSCRSASKGANKTELLHAKLWKERLGGVLKLDLAILRGIVRWAETMEKRVTAKVFSRQLKQYDTWLAEKAAHNVGIIHRLSKPKVLRVDEEETAIGVRQGRQQLANLRSQEWEARWTATAEEEAGLLKLRQGLRERAREETRKPITIEMADAAMAGEREAGLRN